MPIIDLISSLAASVVAEPPEHRRRVAEPREPEEPIRLELLSREELVERMSSLAREHRDQGLSEKPPRRVNLLQSVNQSAQVLSTVYRESAQAARRGELIVPAAEWLIDNFHVVEEQIGDIRRHLPREYYAELPKLLHGQQAGCPRVYSIALALIAHSDGALDETAMRAAIAGYQNVSPLTLGELWAVPIMLRAGLVENLRRLTAPLEEQRRSRDRADRWGERLNDAVVNDPDQVHVLLGEMARERVARDEVLVVRLLQRLRGRGRPVQHVIEWLADQVAQRRGLSLDELVRRQHRRQAMDQVSISNTINSFRTIDRIDWTRVVEALSLVEEVLRRDPAHTHACCDFSTRDRTRHQVERLARRTRRSEVEVAEAALALARRHAVDEPAEGGAAGNEEIRRAYIGYYLLGPGVRELERDIGYRPPFGLAVRRQLTGSPTATYLGAIFIVTLLFLWFGVFLGIQAGASGWQLLLLSVVALLPAVELGVSSTNWLLTRFLSPEVLPRCDYRSGIPEHSRSLVVIPCLFTSTSGIDELIENLEVHYLSNPDPALQFALLSDFTDSPNPEQPDDLALITHAITRLMELNARYGHESSYDKFFVIHRKREWNESQGCWMGWERKRGKLMQLNRLLRGDHSIRFEVYGNATTLQGIRYVICLDADTQLPPDAARRLIGVLSHPLNQPIIDESTRRVVEGYGMLQPRVSISLPSASRSLFTRIFSGNVGVDPYTTAVSDVYQDLFGEGIFVGKGIYDVDAFEAVMHNRVGENVLLSHDLFEGNFARCGLVTDVEFFDDFPTRYTTWSARDHRWIRGDWQLIRWVAPRVRWPDGSMTANPLPLIARWKIFDNLRRSLTPFGTLLFFFAGWFLLPGNPGQWTAMVAMAILFPLYAHLASAFYVDPRKVPLVNYLLKVADDFLTNVEQTALLIAFLPHRASTALDAVIRTVYRVFVSHKKLLEWTSAAVAEKQIGGSLSSYIRRMWAGPLIAAAGALALLIQPAALWAASPLLLLWFFSPAIAYWVSQPIRRKEQVLTEEDRTLLQTIALKTWRFFERFVGPEDNWLPPDNFQELPSPRVAQRTSPTNIGLLLLSTVAARDMGYLGLHHCIERLQSTFETLGKLERYNGHFFNWYDTNSLRPMPPFYISTVDSGNLAGHLLAVKQTLLEMRDAPVFHGASLTGLHSMLAALRASHGESAGRFAPAYAAVERALLGEPYSGVSWAVHLDRVQEAVEALCRQICPAALEELEASLAPSSSEQEPPRPAAEDDLFFWACRLLRQVDELQRDLNRLMPWARLLKLQPAPFGDGKLLDGDLSGRPHIYSDLVTPPNRRARGMLELQDVMDRALAELRDHSERLRTSVLAEEQKAEALDWLNRLRESFEDCRRSRAHLRLQLKEMADRAHNWVMEMDFSFLYDITRDLFSVGFDAGSARLDNYHYDLLASECRLASFLAIAKRDAPQRHWFRLSRALAAGGGDPALVSWSGTMFEYLMPPLIMETFTETLLCETLPEVVRRQQKFAQRKGVPWGISESGFNARDTHMNYQYRAFGVPGLGLHPDLHEDLVVSPYSTLLAVPVLPRECVSNLRLLIKEGLETRFGFYEAIDYTQGRVPRGERGAIVRSFMAHHQGMGLVALAGYLSGHPMRRRFHADPMVKSVELLLQERVPWNGEVTHPMTQAVAALDNLPSNFAESSTRHYRTARTATPRVQLLSNGRYSVMLTNSGGGYSRWRGLAVTRWREDVTRDHWGSFIYLRDLETGDLWGAAHHPVPPVHGEENGYDVYFNDDKVEFNRRREGIVSHLEVVVSPEDDVEIRRLTLTNSSNRAREIEITSYAELVLASQAADQAHSTFSNLFIQTEYFSERNALLATRRPRAQNEERLWAVHVLAHEGGPPEQWSSTEYVTDRLAFVGRGRTPANPAALESDRPLPGSVGAVLDPVFVLRQRVRLGPAATVRLAFTTGAALNREDALRLAGRYHDLLAANRAFDLAWTQSQVELRHLNLRSEQAHLCQRLASRILYCDSYARPPADVLQRNTLQQAGLWAQGMSGDLPIVLVTAAAEEHLSLVQQLLVSQEYLRLKNLSFDLVIINENPPSYLQEFENRLRDMARNAGAVLDERGGVFIRRVDQLPDAARNLLQFVARVVLHGAQGNLADQLDWRPDPRPAPAAFTPGRVPREPHHLDLGDLGLQFFNGYGGFSPDGMEYVIGLGRDTWTPTPWINVIANSGFGFLATETGPGYTWSENSRENRLTPWYNDPVSDLSGEAIYIRHEETGRIWTATPLPIREGNPYIVRHGPGYTRYEHTAHGVEQQLDLLAAPDDAVKIYRLRLRNVSGRAQPLSVTFYAEWVLGVLREQSHPFISTWMDTLSGALMARNIYNNEFAGRIAFAAMENRGELSRSYTADRTEFLGRNGTLDEPAALRRAGLSGRTGSALDPCAALQTRFELRPDETTEIVFLLGEGSAADDCRRLVEEYCSPQKAEKALQEVTRRWNELLQTVQVSTPDPALNLLLNRFLLYQVLACRVWGRSAFYQSGGAFGYRDQLQDVMALVAVRPQLARDQLLLHASRQFVEGDVQHWWHPPTGRGIRTRFSDDLLWLPYATAYYVSTTGDFSVLREEAPFILGRPLQDGEDEYYDQPTIAHETARLYDHCLRALERGMTRGRHGLPLMGTGDWNDGMNKVGHEGRGESVWVAWFLCSIIEQFIPLCRAMDDHASAERLAAAREEYRANIEAHAWDGEWYRRAWFDDGTPLGSKDNDECRIDSLAQTWSIISGAGEKERSRVAMESVQQHLIHEENQLILLFTPPFDVGRLEPGYIKGYVPGVRENGGQYTHAALWVVLATAMQGRGRRAHELFSMLNPVLHATTQAEADHYKAEPYVVAADVYGVSPHTGRGGWTWYTGSASWMYRTALEGLLGFHLRGDHLLLNPCIPPSWEGFKITYRRGEKGVYEIEVTNPHGVECGVSRATLDGEPCDPARIPLLDDGALHRVQVVMGAPAPGSRTSGDGAAQNIPSAGQSAPSLTQP